MTQKRISKIGSATLNILFWICTIGGGILAVYTNSISSAIFFGSCGIMAELAELKKASMHIDVYDKREE